MSVTIAATEVLPTGSILAGGEWLAETSLGRLNHVNPATGKAQATFALAGPVEVDSAVRAARAILPHWKTWTPDARRDVLWRVAELIDAHAGELGSIGTLENGTPAAFAALACATFPAEWFRYYAGWCEKVHGDVVPVYPHRALDYTIAEPCGVVGAIIPWNAPLGILAMKLPAALAAGNCVVVKPSELAPFTALRLGDLCLEAGIPPGVVSVLAGDDRAGRALVTHPGVDKISFTGGASTARSIVTASAERLVPLSLELGGKSANLVFADADLDTAVATAVQAGIVVQSGQACYAPTRLLVEAAVYDQVLDEVVGVAESLTVGDPADQDTIMGPVISEFHCDRILGVIARAEQEGDGVLATGGRRLDGALADGYYVAPTVFAGVDPASSLAQNEIFGPVLSVIPFRTEREAIEVANATRYGLGGFVFTGDVKRAHRVAAELDAGYIGVNAWPILPANVPFGGVKESGYGREGGIAGLLEFTRTKNVYVALD